MWVCGCECSSRACSPLSQAHGLALPQVGWCLSCCFGLAFSAVHVKLQATTFCKVIAQVPAGHRLTVQALGRRRDLILKYHTCNMSWDVVGKMTIRHCKYVASCAVPFKREVWWPKANGHRTRYIHVRLRSPFAPRGQGPTSFWMPHRVPTGGALLPGGAELRRERSKS